MMPSPGYYSYAHNPGDEGIPLTVTVMSESGTPAPEAAQAHYLAGSESPISTGGASYRHEASVPVFLVFREPPVQPTTLDISLLACSDRHCLPIHTRLLLPPPPPELPNAADLPWFPRLLESRADIRQAIPREVPKVAETLVPDQSGPLGDLLPDAHTSVFRKS
ncbi:MAG: hypothetical protein MJ061_03930, partial [Mailhella sp.]|nr:hypothetical protein [Mailhella sp.]